MIGLSSGCDTWTWTILLSVPRWDLCPLYIVHWYDITYWYQIRITSGTCLLATSCHNASQDVLPPWLQMQFLLMQDAKVIYHHFACPSLLATRQISLQVLNMFFNMCRTRLSQQPEPLAHSCVLEASGTKTTEGRAGKANFQVWSRLRTRFLAALH